MLLEISGMDDTYNDDIRMLITYRDVRRLELTLTINLSTSESSESIVAKVGAIHKMQGKL